MTEEEDKDDGSNPDDDGDRTSVLERTAQGTQIIHTAEPKIRPRTSTLPSLSDSSRSSRGRFEGALWIGCVLALGGVVAAWQWTRGVSEAEPATSATMPLELGLTTKPRADEVLVDGKLLAPGQRTVNFPCPDGKHTLEVRAAKHQSVVRETPCTGRVILELELPAAGAVAPTSSSE